MSKTIPSGLILLAMSFILLTGCGQKAKNEIDFGAINNSVYTNKYFGMSATLPADWVLQDQSAQRRLMNRGADLMSGDDKNMQATMKASELSMVNMFADFKYAPGSPVTFNPSILAMAENVQDMPGIKRGSDYHFHARKFMEAGQMKITFPKDIYAVTMGGVSFDVMETEMSINGLTVHQKYYAAIMKGYAVCFVISYNDDEQEAALQKILNTVTFK